MSKKHKKFRPKKYRITVTCLGNECYEATYQDMPTIEGKALGATFDEALVNALLEIDQQHLTHWKAKKRGKKRDPANHS